MDFRSTLEELKWSLVGHLGKWFIDALFVASPVESVGFEKVRDLIASKKFIFAFWHSRILLVSYLYKNSDGIAMVSKSKDGEIIARILQCQGTTPVRGSTKKGGARALAQHIRLLKSTGNLGAVIPDGPQGPRFKVQPGVITLAKKTGYPIIPITYSAKHVKMFNSWDRFILPAPLTPCLAAYGEPVVVPADADAATEECCRRLLEEELCRVTIEADARFGHRFVDARES